VERYGRDDDAVGKAPFDLDVTAALALNDIRPGLKPGGIPAGASKTAFGPYCRPKGRGMTQSGNHKACLG